MTEAESRAAVLQEAASWVRTPYHHEGRIKGGGVDCLFFVYLSYLNAGVIEPVEIARYSPQWHLHRGDETYMLGILRLAHEVESPKPADVVLYREGRTYAHGALVGPEGWPQIIHASADAGIVLPDDGTGGRLAGRSRKFFSLW